MQNQVIANIAIEDQQVEYYSAVVIKQRFNAHHEFAIRIAYDVLGQVGAFKLQNSQRLIGKSTVIKLLDAHTGDAAYEFRGIICEIRMEQSDNFTSELVLKGYSPTILLENGPHLQSFYQKGLKDIVQDVTGAAAQSCTVKNAPLYTRPMAYTCQYKESGFHFLNRLSADYGEWFFYDGKSLFFGKPSSLPEVDIVYGHDVHSMQLALRILPLKFTGYTYLSKKDEFLSQAGPSNVDGLDDFAAFALQESGKVFTEQATYPIKPRVEGPQELSSFLKIRKTAMAAQLEVLTGGSDNPRIALGTIANVQSTQFEGDAFTRGDYGKFLITSVEHHCSDNGRYYNVFEGIPAGVEVIPVTDVTTPVAEPQVATVMDNADPDNQGRVRVQLLWQQTAGEQTDWIRVMTPDAGSGKGNARNRGLVTIPEVGDQVLVCFRYNDPDRPFVMGSLFHGKTGGGGGQGNKSKSLTALSGSVISLDGDAISVVDAAGNKLYLDGAGKININCSSSITLECGGSRITMDSGGKIEITGANITVHGSDKAEMKSTASFKAEGTSAAVHGDATEIKGDSKVDVGSPSTNVNGDANLVLQSKGTINVDGTTMTNVKGGTVNLN